MNLVILRGNLGSDMKSSATPQGSTVANVSLATNKRWKNRQTGEWENKTTWHRLVFFGSRAETAVSILSKGDHIEIQGELETRSWKDNEGKTQKVTEVFVKEFEKLPRGISAQEERTQPQSDGDPTSRVVTSMMNRRPAMAEPPKEPKATGFDRAAGMVSEIEQQPVVSSVQRPVREKIPF